MNWLRRLSTAWRWWNAQCAKHDRRYDALKARRVLTAMAEEQGRHSAVLAFSVDALANLVGAAPGDLPPVLADLERDASLFRDDITGRVYPRADPLGVPGVGGIAPPEAVDGDFAEDLDGSRRPRRANLERSLSGPAPTIDRGQPRCTGER
jgi:hypothetical protein